jgi:histidyl-tRNA synthetase
MSEKLQAPKGTRDLFGEEMRLFTRLEDTARRVFSLYGFSEVRTPIFESVELFTRSLGDTSDVVQKEMFTFTDRGERTFTLRPEGTAGVVRHYIEHSLGAQGGVHRLFYAGPMFRAERPQAGRYRQFFQIGSEYFGSPEATVDADTVLMVARLLTEFPVGEFSIQVNSLGCSTCRPKHREALLNYLKSKESVLSAESKERMSKNPLRVLDSKEDGPKLTDAPAMKDFLCADCKAHYQLFLSLVKKSPYTIEENPRLVRGLDYYTRTVFEFVSPSLGAQSALAAGGRYDNLVEELGGGATPAVGFALGMDRVVAAHQKAATNGLKPGPHAKEAYVIPLDDESIPLAFELSDKLRAAGLSVPSVLVKKKLKNQLSAAVDNGAKWAILIGEDERRAGQATVKNLETRTQEKVPLADVVKFLN